MGLSRRDGTFSEVGIRSWEEAGCAAVEAALMTGTDGVYTLHRPLVVRSARREVQRILRDWCDAPHLPSRCHLVLTVGGTGYSELDIVPDATLPLLRRNAPGIAELLRRTAADVGHLEDAVSRGVAGVRGETLLINLPGSSIGFAKPAPLTAMTRALAPVLPSLVASLTPRPPSDD